MNRMLFLTIVVLLTIVAILYNYGTKATSIEKANIDSMQLKENEQQYMKELKTVPIHSSQHTVDLSIKGEKLYVTYDSGEEWLEVPKELKKIQAGEYQASDKNGMMKKSYYLSEENTSFLYVDHGLGIIQTVDKGKSWQEYKITSESIGLRFRKIDFLTKNFGYVIFSSGRVVRQESTEVYLTTDGGKNWKETANTGNTHLVQAGGFIDEKTGFVSFGQSPNLYVTQYSGASWHVATIQVPDKYKDIFLIAETPKKENDQLTVLLNQGEVGDYLGGFVKGKFVSSDNGMTWTFEGEVESDND
ncbi:conserved hypothetical protein [Carnobacterium maltaromaticum]|uniref:WD40/YVTN/BNR-like repeat-containing protein n=1 Tax=Carnobacterium maltaromaticum TaxID=2751 RepID=UPI001A0E50D8|nr:hypothetical protein [Carnobacterium maltaromaticum]CAD5901915.1 conserved hypothetical protein [Carnobacterium maltaromaticum]